MDFDAIVMGSGISGGWVAKELCERGLKTLLIERGRNVTHRVDYLDFAAPWEVPNRGGCPRSEVRRALRHPEHGLRVQRRHPAMVGEGQRTSVPHAEGRAFHWIRGYHLGGRSLTWGRQAYR